jgi:putative restriction endonuclease
MNDSKPLVWFVGIGPGMYMPVYPIWLVGEEPAERG